ncbi:hypothetical protein KS419_22900 [Bacillus tamaricis]|uniref:Uncharacterized protein n=2 Tax=Evansella tamaricis TaxID=2069301 RepID=A0ABS6JLR0_9BACI|nr:hypothetical protein [Evansella tamaricis]MBU9714597.1 hypothetical protein [Evansella tamaricis]
MKSFAETYFTEGKGYFMVNQDFDKFINEQEKHKSSYLKGANTKKGRKDQGLNRGTDTSVGAEGRDILKN